MSVTVDYLVVCSDKIDLMELLTETLKNALEDVDDAPPEAEELRQHINIRHTTPRENGHRVCGFSVEFDSAAGATGELIHDFSQSVADCIDEGIGHLLKLNDPQLRRTLRDYGDEIFEIEMKLREALSLIFVDTYGENFYALLKEVRVEPTGKEAPEESQMQAQCENQFFFLLFSDYININVRKQINLNRIVEYMGQAEDFEGLRQMITTNPITTERYVDFLESLKQRVDPIEKLRNCVAHNRSISRQIIDDYEMAKDLLLAEIKEFLEEQENSEVKGETETGN